MNFSIKTILLVAVGGLLSLSQVGCATSGNVMENARLRAAVIAQTPRVELVAGDGSSSAMSAAEGMVARSGSNQYEAMLGAGESMEPLYRPGTAIVVKRVRYGEVKRGMTVVYNRSCRDGTTHLVAHVVIDEDARGWVVQGLNNSVPDNSSVNEANMVGVVVAAYAANPKPARALVAMR